MIQILGLGLGIYHVDRLLSSPLCVEESGGFTSGLVGFARCCLAGVVSDFAFPFDYLKVLNGDCV